MDKNLSLSLDQFKAAWHTMCAMAPRFERKSLPGMEFIFSGLSIPFFNVILPTEPVPSAEALTQLGKEATAAAAPYGVPWLFSVTHELLVEGIDPDATLKPLGLVPMVPVTGMVVERVASLAQMPHGLELTVPRDDATCADIVNLNTAAYAVDMSESMPILGSHKFWSPHYPVVAKLDGKPVSCSAVMMLNGYRYVLFVATHPDHQRKGYADAAMRASLENAAAAQGELPTFLHATDAGRPVYARMGYVAVSRHMLYIEEKFLAGH